MVETTTIRVELRTKKLLDKCKIYSRETYDDILMRLLDNAKDVQSVRTNG